MKAHIIFFLVSVLILASCKKNSTNPVNSNCLLQSYESSDNSQAYKINYDANNQVISVEATGSNYTSIVPSKDANNRVYKVDYYNGTTLTTETTYQFDATNRIILVSYYQQGALVGYASWTYNNNGNRPTEQKLYNVYNGNTSLSGIDDYSYDSHGNLLTDGLETFTYDDKPNATRALSFFPVALAGNVNNITSDITKDASGNVTSSLTSTYTYDNNGNVTQRKTIDNYGVSTIYNYTFLCH